MTTIRPAGATHCDDYAKYYKADPVEPFNWMRWSDHDNLWLPVGTMPAGSLTPLPAVQVVELEKFGAPQAPTLPHPVRPSEAEKWPCAPVAAAVPYADYFVQYRFVGSRVTCNPPPLDTDQDVLVQVHASNMAVVQDKLLNAGFVREGSNPTELNSGGDAQSVFHSFRKGDMNYIITSDPAFYERFSTATELARKLNLLEKSDRIQLFQAVLYGKWWA